MGFWPRRRPAPQSQPERARQQFTVTMPAELSGLWTSAAGVARSDALSVPAVLKSRNLICSGLGVLPLHMVDPGRNVVPSSLLDQPEDGLARSVTLTMLYEDLLLEGIAWWRVTRRAWTTYPDRVERLEPSRVAVYPDGSVYVDGSRAADEDLIRFDSPNPGLLTAAARAIRTCLLLDQTAARYAAEPLPLGLFELKDGQPEPSPVVVQDAIDGWTTASQTRTTGYVGGALNYKTVQWSPEQLQLADARQHAVLEIARAVGVSPEDLGVSTTSRSYSNLEMDQQKFVTEALQPYGQAVAERLSMGDVTPRGYRVRVEYAGRLRTDTATRYATYGAGLDVGALGVDEIRELEDKPKLAASQRPKVAVPPMAPAQPAQEAVVQHSADLGRVEAFSSAGETVTLSFSPSEAEEFKADPQARTVSGMLLPFGVQTADGRRFRFAPGSIEWAKAAVSRIKLDREHDLGQLLGSATKVTASDSGVSAAFKVAKTPAGDEALALAADGALDGLSAVVSITEAVPDPVHEGGTLVTSARLHRATLTAEPAFDDARLTGVSLTAHKENPVTDPVLAATAPASDQTAAFTAAVESFTSAVEKLSAPQGREVIPAGRAVGMAVTEAPVYSFSGHGDSLVRDAWRARQDGDSDAAARLRKFTAQMAEFATVNRTVGANVIPPGYRPDLFVPQLLQGRPLFEMVSKGSLSDATPFTVPVFGSATGATADHVEGTNPSDGTLAFGTSKTVTPGGISGRFRITREIIDAANPAIDAIAAQALRESYSQQTEGKVYTLLNGAAGVGGTITSGFVPSGAAVVTATGVGSTGAAGVALINAVRQQLVEYPFRRFARPDRLAASSEASVAFAKAVDSTGRPLLPRLGAMNAQGNGNALQGAFDLDGLAATPAWSMTGNAAGDADTILFNSNDVWAWESSLLSMKYEEVAGPANVDIVIFGYFAAQVLRGSGFSGVRLTVT